MAVGSLDPQGPAAEAMADLWWLMLGLGVAVFLVFAVLLVTGLFRQPTSELPADRRLGQWLTGWGVVAPLVILTVVFGATVWAMRVLPTQAPDDALVIEVVGHQWRYEVSYPDEGVSVTNELHLPTDRPIALRLTSADVIHSFWVPSLGGKMDMLPDGVNTLVLEASEPGEHESLCAEFCGLHHADMRLTVVAEPAEQFEEWVTEQREAGSADAGRGALSPREGGAR